MNQDLLIAREATLRPIVQIAQQMGICDDDVEPYGRYKAKVRPQRSERAGKLILVTAINPTPAGEGKTTVSIGLADGLRKIGKKSVLALREPSLGPVFGVKGGAAGGGHAQIAPMEDINLHFTGDLHAIAAANNLLAAMVDNHIFQGSEPEIDPMRVSVRRCMDMNDRQLRSIVSGLGGATNGVSREDGFDITAASQLMAIFCLAEDMEDLKARLSRIVVGYNRKRQPVTAQDIGAVGAMAALLRDALSPNLVQTLEGTPAFVHGGPFANIAHGCNSVIATHTALSYGDYCVTEAGFGADLGAEKFLDIKCRQSGLAPDCVVLVATIRALKYHGGVAREDLGAENVDALVRGCANLGRHMENLSQVYGMNVVVAINRFVSDSQAEINALSDFCVGRGVPFALCDGWAKGGEGAKELAQMVVEQCGIPSTLTYAYEDGQSLREKIEAVAKKVYGASSVSFATGVVGKLGKMPQELAVCIAKTQYSFSDQPKRLGRPDGFTLTIRDVSLSAGAGFVVAFAGDIIAMPGLPPRPAALEIDVVNDQIEGIF